MKEIQEENEDNKEKKPSGKMEKMTRELTTVITDYTLSKEEHECPRFHVQKVSETNAKAKP